MIVIGSYPLALAGIRSFQDVKDLDLIGTQEDAQRFRTLHKAIIESEREEHGHRLVFNLKDATPWKRIEIDFEQSTSDKLLLGLCKGSTQVLNFELQVPPVEVLYLIKRAHANVPVHYAKTIRDIIQLKPLLGYINKAQHAFYLERKKECQSRYMLHRQRFSLSVRNEDFFDLSDHVRTYVHDDLHEAVAYVPNQPLYKQCKRDLSLAKIDVDLFEALSMDDRLRMVQEEFMVIGLERFYLHDNTLSPKQVYMKGMHKTIRDLFVGYFQDFCIDHINSLLEPPPYDFVERFQTALRDGRVRQVEIIIPAPSEEHKLIWKLINDNQLNEARRRSEDLVRHADAPGDTHAFFLLGVVLLKSKQFAQAEKCLRHCVTRDRKNRVAWHYLGKLCRLAGRHEEAIKHLLHAKQLGLGNFGLFCDLGLALEAAGKIDAAVRAYMAARSIRSGVPNLERKLVELTATRRETPYSH